MLILFLTVKLTIKNRAINPVKGLTESQWTFSVFPLSYGVVSSSFFGEYELNNFDFCYLSNPILIGTEVYSNGDLLSA